MYDEDDVRDVRGLSHGQPAWGVSTDGDVARIVGDSRRRAEALNRSLMDDVSAGLRVLVTRDGVPLTEVAIRERAANIVAGLVGNYQITRLDGVRFETAEQHAARIIR